MYDTLAGGVATTGKSYAAGWMEGVKKHIYPAHCSVSFIDGPGHRLTDRTIDVNFRALYHSKYFGNGGHIAFPGGGVPGFAKNRLFPTGFGESVLEIHIHKVAITFKFLQSISRHGFIQRPSK